MKTSKKLAIYYRYRNEEIRIRNNLLDMFDLYENYRKSKYKSLGNYLRYEGYQSIADRIIYQYEYGTDENFKSMMSDIYNISKELHDDLQRLFNQNYSTVLSYKIVKAILYCATHLTK